MIFDIIVLGTILGIFIFVAVLEKINQTGDNENE